MPQPVRQWFVALTASRLGLTRIETNRLAA
jgi:hypothetical protein